MPPSVFASFSRQVRRAKADPDLSQKLANGLSYLNADEMDEMQQALAMAIYAHSLNSKHGGGYDAVKVRTSVVQNAGVIVGCWAMSSRVGVETDTAVPGHRRPVCG